MDELKLPATIKFNSEPYTYDALIGELSVTGAYNGHPIVSGVVLKGTETAFLWGASSTKSIVGQRVTIYGVKQWELDRGHIVRIAS